MPSLLARIRFARDHRWSPGRMSEYIDDDLERNDRERLEHHVHDCPECGELLASLESMIATLGSMPGRPADSVASAVLAGVQERLGRDDGPGR
ncbi:MAG: putative zinc-finger [Thermoleophilaceae bacterium]|nr:putative zinc-finger [Thermoleophilaceae bacterium]